MAVGSWFLEIRGVIGELKWKVELISLSSSLEVEARGLFWPSLTHFSLGLAV